MSMKTSNQPFKERIKVKMQDTFMLKSVANAQNRMSHNRILAVEALGHWEDWRTSAMEMRNHVLENLDYYLYQLSEKVESNGGHVFFAKDAKAATDYITNVVAHKQAKKVVKAKSMVSEEIGLNKALVDAGCQVQETDLGEYILQEDNHDAPSHIVVPAIHKNREQVRKLFHDKLGYEGDSIPENLTRFVRQHIRQDFLEADIGITGCNFAVAESGSVVLVTNEGNARLATSLPKTHIAVMGMERIVPTFEEVDIMVSMLCRSAVGLPLTGYITILTGPREEPNSLGPQCDGPEEFHLVIVDNGRSRILGSQFQDILRCIRCAACINTCPAYRHIGGQAYGSIYPGPIGAVLSPLLGGYQDFHDLPYACSLCKACNEVCPVKIPLSDLLLKHRQVMAEEGLTPNLEKKGVQAFNYINSSNLGWGVTMKATAIISKIIIKNGKLPFNIGILNAWCDSRDLPTPDGQSYRSWFKQHKKES